jgi:hypothetical protein
MTTQLLKRKKNVQADLKRGDEKMVVVNEKMWFKDF